MSRAENDGQQFDRLPRTPADRRVSGRVSRREVLEYFEGRFGIPPDRFDDFTFWEKGAGRIWVTTAGVTTPVRVEAVGMTVLRTRQEYWKPTTDAVQRFGRAATRNVLVLEPAAARAFVAGRDGPRDWDGDWGYLIVAHELRGAVEPLGVGLYVHGELRSMIPKGRRRSLSP